jgi:hypothetical protein
MEPDPVNDCRNERGEYAKPEDCPYNPAPSRIWSEAVDGWDWHYPEDPDALRWKSGPCPRCGTTMTVEAPGPAAGESVARAEHAAVQADLQAIAAATAQEFGGPMAAENVLAYCDCGLNHPGRNEMPGCGPAAYIRPPKGAHE